MSTGEKDKKFWTILETAIDLDFKKGHLRWTLSELSRAWGMSRPLIYYYFGQSKSKLLEEAVRLVGSEIMGLSEARLKLWESQRGYEPPF